MLFLDEASSKQLCDCDMPQRLTTQFHWFNHSYRDFQDFLDRFSSRKRKNLRRERDRIAQQGLSLKTLKGDEIASEHWQFFFHCYQTTYAKRSGHGGYLTEAFFTETCPILGQSPVMAATLPIAFWPAVSLSVAYASFSCITVDGTTMAGWPTT